MKPYVEPLGKALGHLQQATMWFMAERDGQAGQRRRGLDRLHAPLRAVRARLHVGRMAAAAQDKLKAGANGADERMKAKLVTGRFFMERVLPETAAQLARIQAGAASTMELPAEAVLAPTTSSAKAGIRMRRVARRPAFPRPSGLQLVT